MKKVDAITESIAISCYIYGFTYEEVGEILEMDGKTVWRILDRNGIKGREAKARPWIKRKPSINTKQASVSPTVQELAWSAGFLEGEGYFKGVQQKTITPCAYAYIQCSQVQKEPVERLLKYFGGSLKQYGPYSTNRQAYWQWTVYGDRALGVMMTLYKFMSPKRQQEIREVIALWKPGEKPSIKQV